MLVAYPVGGCQDVLGEPRPLFEDALEQVAVQIVPAEGPVVVLEIEHLVHDEADVAERSAVGVHDMKVRGGGTRSFYRQLARDHGRGLPAVRSGTYS